MLRGWLDSWSWRRAASPCDRDDRLGPKTRGGLPKTEGEYEHIGLESNLWWPLA
jgi:hypothetical protein